MLSVNDMWWDTSKTHMKWKKLGKRVYSAIITENYT